MVYHIVGFSEGKMFHKSFAICEYFSIKIFTRFKCVKENNADAVLPTLSRISNCSFVLLKFYL